MFSKIRQILGLETDEEKMFRYKELQQEFTEVSSMLDNLADTFLLEKSLYEKRIKNEDNYVIQQRITNRWNNFVEIHKEEIRKAKKEYNSLRDRVTDIEKSLDGKIEQYRLFNTIKKAYKSGLMGLVDYNESLKRITKDKVTKYSDFILFNENGELLLLKRSTWEDDHQGAWVIPGGHVDLGEDFESAALRELWEESGFRPENCKNVGNYIDDKVHIEYYQGVINTKEQSPLLDVNESRDYRWINLDDIDDYNMIFNMKDNVKKILNLKVNKININKSSNFNLEEVSNEGDNNILKQQLHFEYKKFFNELNKAKRKQLFLIQKGFTEEAEKLNEQIEKAKKDISKLNKIKKLIYRDGKLVYGTYYVKTGEEIEDKDKTSSAGNINQDIVQGNQYLVKYKKKGSGNINVKGSAEGFCYTKADNMNWFAIVDENGEKHWLNNKNVLQILNSGNAEVKEDEYKVVQNLGGSTGAKLVIDKYGNRYVKKTGKDKAHITSEYEALQLYKALGVQVPSIHKFDKDKGELYTQYIDNAFQIDSDSYYAKSSISRNFAIDALLANWDVVGLGYDNILQAINGFYRVDVGGSLDKRAQGEDKVFGPEVNELKTLLDPNINPQTAKIFSGVDVDEAIKHAVKQYDLNLDKINKLDVRQEIKDTLAKRVEYLRSLAGIKSPAEELEQLNYNGKLYDVDPNYYDKSIVDFYDKLNEDLKIDSNDLAQITTYTKFQDEDSARKYLLGRMGLDPSDKNYGSLINNAIANGVTWRELVALNTYTGSSDTVNSLVRYYVDSNTGNLNFDKTQVASKVTEIRMTDVQYDMEYGFNLMLDAVKSINFAIDSGKKANEANSFKLEAAKDKFVELKEFINKEIKYPGTFTKEQVDKMHKLLEIYTKIRNSLDSDTKIENITNEGFDETISLKREEKVEVNIPGTNINGFGGRSYGLTLTKLICHAIRKLEDIKNKDFYVEGLFNRGIDTNKYGAVFNAEHNSPNTYVMHTWGSSSSWKTDGFVDGRDTHLKIIGKGVHIEQISEYKGGAESEVLNRPFSLYKTISYIPSNEKGKKEIVLMKVL